MKRQDLGLQLVTLRLRKVDVKRARQKAKELGIPYQAVIRAWVATAVGDETVGSALPEERQ